MLFFVKTPLPILALLLCGAALAGRRWTRSFARRRHRDSSPTDRVGACGTAPTPIAAPRDLTDRAWRTRSFAVGCVCVVGSFAAAAMASPYNVGHRHLLPVYPFVYVAVALAAARLWSCGRKWRISLTCLAAWYLVDAVRTHPDELAFFNQLIGPQRNAAFIAADSNLDWGQDMLKLARIQRERGWPVLKMSYFGSGDPAAYGVRAAYLRYGSRPENGEPAPIEPGVYAFSLSCLRLAVLNMGFDQPVTDWTPALAQRYAQLASESAAAGQRDTPESADRRARELDALVFIRLATALRDVEPDAIAGRSVYVYELGSERLAAILRP